MSVLFVFSGERRFIVVGSIASGGLAMHVSAWIIVPWLLGLLRMSSDDKWLVYMYNRPEFLVEDRSGMEWSSVNMLEERIKDSNSE
jgi:hypothetical protein